MSLTFTENKLRSTGLAASGNVRSTLRAVGLAEASQAEAEAGTLLGRLMSPLRVFQAIASYLLSGGARIGNDLTVGTTTPYQGSSGDAATTTIEGSLDITGVDTQLYVPFPTFGPTDGTQYAAANAINVTFSDNTVQGGAALASQATIEGTASSVTAAAGLVGGWYNKRSSPTTDGGGVLGYAANSVDVADSQGAAVWGIMRRYCGQGTSFAHAFRASSETDGDNSITPVEDHPHAGLYVFNSTNVNQFINGVVVAAATTYGVRVGRTGLEGGGTTTDIYPAPTHPFSFFDETAAEPYYVDDSGHVITPSLDITGTASLFRSGNYLILGNNASLGVSVGNSVVNQNLYDNTEHIFRGAGAAIACNVVLNGHQVALATTATFGFTYIPTCAGPPTGTPSSTYTGNVPMVYDTADDKLYVYNGSWKFVTLS